MEEEDLLRRISVQSFYSIFPDEESCLRMFPTVCSVCGPTTPVEIEIGRKFTCFSCGKLNWRTAGTFFSGARRVLPGFLLIWLIEDQISINASQLSRVADCVYSTAWELVRRMRELCLDEMLQTKDQQFNVFTTIFDQIIYRRSKLTPAEEHPRLEGLREALEIEFQENSKQTFNCEEERKLFEALSTEPTHVEVVAQKVGIDASFALVALTGLEMANMVIRLPGERFVVKPAAKSLSKELCDEQIAVVADFLNSVRRFGSSRKYLQLAIAQFWATTNRVKWRATTLFDSCLRYDELGYKSFRNYVSPTMIKMISS